jgi:hypothetical protein
MVYMWPSDTRPAALPKQSTERVAPKAIQVPLAHPSSQGTAIHIVLQAQPERTKVASNENTISEIYFQARVLVSSAWAMPVAGWIPQKISSEGNLGSSLNGMTSTSTSKIAKKPRQEFSACTLRDVRANCEKLQKNICRECSTNSKQIRYSIKQNSTVRAYARENLSKSPTLQLSGRTWIFMY